MKKILFTSAMILSANLYANPFDVTGDNPDLYDGYTSSKIVPTAIQPGIGDNYASSFLFPSGYIDGQHTAQRGSYAGYGSTLLDMGHDIDW